MKSTIGRLSLAFWIGLVALLLLAGDIVYHGGIGPWFTQWSILDPIVMVLAYVAWRQLRRERLAVNK